jgi:hypothetical protein
MSAANLGQFYLDLSRGLVKLRGDGYNPDLAIVPNVCVRSHDHGRPALPIAVLRVEQFPPDDPATTELGHDGLPSVRLALVAV